MSSNEPHVYEFTRNIPLISNDLNSAVGDFEILLGEGKIKNDIDSWSVSEIPNKYRLKSNMPSGGYITSKETTSRNLIRKWAEIWRQTYKDQNILIVVQIYVKDTWTDWRLIEDFNY